MLPIDLTAMRPAASRHTRIAEVQIDFGYPGKRRDAPWDLSGRIVLDGWSFLAALTTPILHLHLANGGIVCRIECNEDQDVRVRNRHDLPVDKRRSFAEYHQPCPVRPRAAPPQPDHTTRSASLRRPLHWIGKSAVSAKNGLGVPEVLALRR